MQTLRKGTELSSEVRLAYLKTREIFLEHGDNLDQRISEWIEEILKSVREYSADADFRQLCASGCNPFGLALGIVAGDVFPSIARVFRIVFGMNWELASNARKLRSAIAVLKKLPLAKPEAEALFSKLACNNPKRPPVVSEVIYGLEFYMKYFELFELLARRAEIRSKNDLPRYFLTAYVKLATGKWHDKQVSGVLQPITRGIYEETTHRVWRNRNFARLNKQYHALPELLLTFAGAIFPPRFSPTN